MFNIKRLYTAELLHGRPVSKAKIAKIINYF
jgi:hypothetical protein